MLNQVKPVIVEGNDSGSKEEEGAKKKVSWEDAGGQEQQEDEDTPLIEHRRLNSIVIRSPGTWQGSVHLLD